MDASFAAASARSSRLELGSAALRGRSEVRAVELDFATKHEQLLDSERAVQEIKRGKFVWIDVLLGADGRIVLESLGLIETEIIDDALHNEPLTRLARFNDYLHMVVSGCRPSGLHFDLERVDVVMGQKFMLTIHRDPVLFLSAVQRDYKSDFERFAQSPSFLIYEIWDHLIDNYLNVQKMMEQRVEEMQDELRRDKIDAGVFGRISELGAHLLHFRKIILPARAVLTDLATRKSMFVSEATQPYLANMVGAVEHVLQDLLVDRDILSESLNLYMSAVGHRTNEVMRRLTTVSVVFLPLTFLVGVYGMNFEYMPELGWRNGYLYFWLVAVGIAVGLALLLRRLRLL